MMRILTPAMLCLLLLNVPLARADAEAVKAFDQLFGEAVKQVNSTLDPADDINLAKKLIEASATATDRVPLMVVMLERAYDLCAKDASGTAAAVEAMEALADRLPDRRVAATQKILSLLQRDYIRAKPADLAAAGEALLNKLVELGEARAANSDYSGAVSEYTKALPVAIRIKSAQEPVVRGRIVALTHRNRVENYIASLKERILKDRTDKASATELVMQLVTEIDKPTIATQYLDMVNDEDVKKQVALAAKDVAELEPADILGLGTWYESLAKKVSSLPAKRVTLGRSASYLESYIEKSSPEELTRLQADLALKRVQTALKELSPEPSAKEPAEKIFTFTGRPLAIEAEKAQVIEEPMKIEKTGSASGGAYVWKPGVAGQRAMDGPGHVVFHVKVAEATEVYIWGHVRSLGGEANSFYLAVAADKVTTGNRRDWNLPEETRNWTWAPFTDARDRRRGFGRFGGPPQRDPEPLAVRLEAGVNSIMIFPREHGAQLDGIYISKSNEKPQGR